jgi:hypothetical protein
MKKPYRQADGFYHVDGKKYKTLFGSREQVMNGTVHKTTGGLTKADLVMNKWGRIVSANKFKTAKKEMRLQKHGFFAKKGKFGAITRKFRGGDPVDDAAEKITNINPVNIPANTLANTFVAPNVAPVVDPAVTTQVPSTDVAPVVDPAVPTTPAAPAAPTTSGGTNIGASKKTRSHPEYDDNGNVKDKYDKDGNLIKKQNSKQKSNKKKSSHKSREEETNSRI